MRISISDDEDNDISDDDQAFPVATVQAWNALPESYIASRRQMNTQLFKASFNNDRCYCCCDCRHVICDTAVCTVSL